MARPRTNAATADQAQAKNGKPSKTLKRLRRARVVMLKIDMACRAGFLTLPDLVVLLEEDADSLTADEKDEARKLVKQTQRMTGVTQQTVAAVLAIGNLDTLDSHFLSPVVG